MRRELRYMIVRMLKNTILGLSLQAANVVERPMLFWLIDSGGEKE